MRCKFSCRLIILCLMSFNDTAISLKDDPCTNAGRGSNLTEDGRVECDASIMDGDSGAFGAVGAVPGILNAELCMFYLN